MPISIMQWRVEIGMFFRKSKVRCRDRILLPTIRPLFSCSSGFCFAFIMLTLLTCGDIESNPGPRRSDSCYNFSICHWNLNSMTAHNFEKINLLAAYNTINKFDVICLSESYLDSSIAFDNDNLNIKGSTTLIMIKEAVYVHTLGNRYLLDALLMQECLILEISINNKKGYVASLYRSPSQTPDECDSFINDFEEFMIDSYSRKADFVLMIGDFNAKSCDWSINDTTTPQGAQLDSITSLYGMKQLISEPTHILQQSSSCIDLIFTNQPNIVMDSGGRFIPTPKMSPSDVILETQFKN